MHSERALSASALVMPLVLALHSAILLCGLAGAGVADRQVFMNVLRSSPFMSAAYALAQANTAKSASMSNGFIDFSLLVACKQDKRLSASLRHRRAARQR